MISKETILISERPGSNEDESVNHFIKIISIDGTHKSISAERNNTFAKRKNQIDLSGNRSCGNISQEAGNVLKEDSSGVIISGNKLKEANGGIQKAGNKLKEDGSNLKYLGNGLIFVETYRQNGNPFSI